MTFTPGSLEQLRAGREAMRARCEAIAVKHTPEGATLTFHRSLSGRAWVEKREMTVPRPVTRKSLYIYLHECAHIMLDHRGQRRSFQQEAEAERWAQRAMREEGLAVPRAMLKRAKEYVARKKRHGDNVSKGLKARAKLRKRYAPAMAIARARVGR